MHRHNIDVANEYAGESDFVMMEVVVQRPAAIKGQGTTTLPEGRDFAEPVPAQTTCQAAYIGMSMAKSTRSAKPRLDHIAVLVATIQDICLMTALGE